MKLLLIRHGETVDNIAQVYAGVTDSALTVHGSLQASRLATHIADTKFQLTHIFSSDLQRARKTAEAVLLAQQRKYDVDVTLKELEILREQDFGSFEKQPFNTRPKGGSGQKNDGMNTAVAAGRSSADSDVNDKMQVDGAAPFRDVESKGDMAARANRFLDQYLLPLLLSSNARQEAKIAVVSHGKLLSSLWRCILKRFALHSVTVAPDHLLKGDAMTSLEHLGSWSNTGYLELHVHKLPIYMRGAKVTQAVATSNADPTGSDAAVAVLYDWTLAIKAINSKEHLRGLKRTGGGVGSSEFSEDQKTIETYFKRQKVG